jgi:hypothetical protein
MSTYRVVMTDPVLFTANAGGGPNEYAFTNLPNPANTVTVAFPGLGATETIIGAWYTPLDNIAALSQFATILVSPNGKGVDVTAHGYPNTASRVRVGLYAFVQMA